MAMSSELIKFGRAGNPIVVADQVSSRTPGQPLIHKVTGGWIRAPQGKAGLNRYGGMHAGDIHAGQYERIPLGPYGHVASPWKLYAG